eukprot:gene31586-53910_t
MLFPELGVSAYAIDDLFMQDALLRRVEAEIGALVAASATLKPVLIVGAPLAHNGRLYNCAVAISRERILGVVPKSFLPNYREYYEKRWFAPGAGVAGLEMTLAGQRVPFGTDLVFAADDLAALSHLTQSCGVDRRDHLGIYRLHGGEDGHFGFKDVHGLGAVDRVLNDVTLRRQVGGDVQRGVTHQQGARVAGHVQDEAVAHTPTRPQPGRVCDDSYQQFVRMQGPFHDRRGVALR